MERFDVSGARGAASLSLWLVELLRREPGANRSLAAIVKGQDPVLEGPIRVPLEGLPQDAGPGPGFKWPKDPATWEREVEALAAVDPDALPPLLVRETGGVVNVPDGNHRLDAWRRRGESHGWAIVWRDRDPRFAGWWGPFPPDDTPRLEFIDPARVEGFLPALEAEGRVFAALCGERVVGALRLVPEFGSQTLRTMRVDPLWRGRRLGARMLHHLRPHLDEGVVHVLAYPWLQRFYGEFGFRPVGPGALPKGLRRRWESMQDEKGCAAMRRPSGDAPPRGSVEL